MPVPKRSSRKQSLDIQPRMMTNHKDAFQLQEYGARGCEAYIYHDDKKDEVQAESPQVFCV
jgi:hypothetical protein